MSWHFESLADYDIAQTCDLFATVFGHPITPEHWRWKYQQGPRLGAFNFIARDQSGHIVGHVGASVFPGLLLGQVLPMAQVSDVMVHPDVRSAFGQDQGVYPQLMKRLQQALHTQFPVLYTYGFVGIRPYRLGERMGLYRSRQFCRTGLMTPPPKPALVFRAHCQARAVDWPVAFSDGLFDATLLQARRHSRRPLIERSAAYMRWRYAEHPVHQYQLWAVRTWWQDAGWMVTRHMPSGQHMLIDQWPAPDAEATDPQAQRHMNAVLRQLAAQSGPAPVLASWRIDTEAARQSEPVIGIEIRTHDWQDQIASPIFTPGDTDVY